MIKILEFILCGGITLIEIIGVLIIAIIIQYIFRKVFRINPVRIFLNKLNEIEKYF